MILDRALVEVVIGVSELGVMFRYGYYQRVSDAEKIRIRS